MSSLFRTNLYAGGSSPAKMQQARFFAADCIVYDLEDSVAETEKDAARLLVYQTLTHHRPPNKYVIIRVNGIYSPYLDEDLEMAVLARPDAIRIPKVEHADEVRNIEQKITKLEEKYHIEVSSTRIWCNIESYPGALQAMEIASCSNRIEALALGAEDFTASLNARRTKQGLEIFHARNLILLACRNAGVCAIDAVFSDINDLEGLQEDTILTRNLGFDGKTVIHPRQIDVVNSCFTPSQREIYNAIRILQALEEGAKQKTGVVVVDGSMVDKPMELRAQTILAQARAAGLEVSL
ncbi:MAG: aldolase/citrate lyase family protein [Eubacteriales bacterium]